MPSCLNASSNALEFFVANFLSITIAIVSLFGYLIYLRIKAYFKRKIIKIVPFQKH